MQIVNSTYKKHLFVDARDFASTMTDKLEFNIFFSKTNQLSLTFPPFEKVKQAELKAISFPKMNNDDIYFIFDVYELNGRLNSSDNNGSHDSFAVIYYDNSAMPAGTIRPMKGKDFDEKVVTFDPVEHSLGRLSVKFKKYGGEIISISDIDPSINDMNAFLEKYNISFMIEFTCQRY
jgi:hypothetical protein